ncbi:MULTISPECIES: PRC-barrel domain-containing protein [unclassified Marinovum]
MKKFLSTAAIALVMSSGAYAASHVGVMPNFEFDSATNIYASELIGSRIYATENETGDEVVDIDDGWDDIGEVNEVILSRDGKVNAVIVGIGGFLGIGEKDVTISMDQLKFVADEDDEGEYFLVVNASRQMLEDAEIFERNNMDMDADKAEMETEVEVESDVVAKTDATTETVAQDVDVVKTDDMAKDKMADDKMAKDHDANMGNMEREMLMRPDVTRDGFVAAELEEMTSENLTGARVYGVNDEDVGEVSELILSDDGKVERVILDIGGFLGLGEHQVAVTFDELNIQRADGGGDFRVYIDATEDSLEAQPEYEG